MARAMKEVLKKGDSIPFTQVANAVLSDNFLSFKAKGLYAYLYSKDNNYDFAAKRIAKDSSDGMDSVLAGLKELEAGGYIERKKLKTGRVVYTIHIAKSAKPHSGKKPKRENPNQGKSLIGKSPSINNIDTSPTNIEIKPTFISRKEKISSFQKILIPAFEERWDKNSGSSEELIESLRFSLKAGDETVCRVPAMIASYLDIHPSEWRTKKDFMATTKNLSNAIFDAEVEDVSMTAWNNAVSKTEFMDMATIRTVIKSI